MCGIFAAIATTPRGLAPDADVRVRRALKQMAHRGPDGQGAWVDIERGIAVGHVRLAVIDLRPESNQPFWSPCGNHVVVFNGEIYNYLEIRRELEQCGVEFRTQSDTEVLLAALMTWGEAALSRFNGMWAFVYVDLVAKRAFLSRDRCGVKPMYVCEADGEFLVASEAKGIIAYRGQVPQPDIAVISQFLKYSVGGESSRSWFHGIERFPVASSQALKLGAPSESLGLPRRFWDFPRHRLHDVPHDVEGLLLETLDDAIRIRLRSDVPLGLSLSGGLDSTMIAWRLASKFAHPVDAFTAWFEPRSDSELIRAEATCNEFGHRSNPIAESSQLTVMGDIRDCVYHLDSGWGGPAIVSYLNICRAARSKLTVMLEGQGADELFGGYSYLLPFFAMDQITEGQFRQFGLTMLRHTRSDGSGRVFAEWLRYSNTWLYNNQFRRWGSAVLGRQALKLHEREDHFKIGLGRDNASRALLFSHSHGLVNLLQYGDALSMAVGLETRCPFLDYRLVELGFQLPATCLVHDGWGKYILRKVGSQALSGNVAWPRKKLGFANRVEATIRKSIALEGISEQAIGAAIDYGLLSTRALSRDTLIAIPDGAFFRVVSLLMWLDVFYINPGHRLHRA
jgi:asparagine synthase (glutamine-hydrolysing)